MLPPLSGVKQDPLGPADKSSTARRRGGLHKTHRDTGGLLSHATATAQSKRYQAFAMSALPLAHGIGKRLEPTRSTHITHDAGSAQKPSTKIFIASAIQTSAVPKTAKLAHWEQCQNASNWLTSARRPRAIPPDMAELVWQAVTSRLTWLAGGWTAKMKVEDEERRHL